MGKWFGAYALIPHGFCLSWDPNPMGTIALSNAVIALAYMIISIVFTNQAIEPRPAAPRLLYWTFEAFIFCRGVSHVLDDVTLWLPIPVARPHARDYGVRIAVDGCAAGLDLGAAGSRTDRSASLTEPAGSETGDSPGGGP